ncbi:MAG TPA: hypothetical protein VK034_14780, partial [Enhygromyxa sp.]|nr:hypothetical protein [Enhygromyxa sp.]
MSAQWFENLLILGAGVVVGLVAVVAIRLLVRYTLGRRAPETALRLRERGRHPLTLLMPILGFYAAIPFTTELPGQSSLRTAALILVIILFAWLLVRIVQSAQHFLSRELSHELADDANHDNL